MPLDPDAEQILEMLAQNMPVPGKGTDVAELRAQMEMAASPAEPTALARVEDRTIAGPGGALRLRYFADAPGPLPTLLYFHGGGFATCSIDTHDSACRKLAKETGIAVLSVDYRLSPETRFPGAIEDAHAALLWAAGPEGASLGIDGTRLAVGGDSAGGQIAAALCLYDRDHGGDHGGHRICHQLLIYPVLDATLDTPSYRENATGYFLTAASMRWYWEQYLGADANRADPLVSPVKAPDLASLPPATILTAGYDPLRDEGRSYAQRLADAGVAVVYRNFAGTFHGFMGMSMLSSAREGLEFIAASLKASPSLGLETQG